MTPESDLFKAFAARYRNLFEERKAITTDLRELDKEAIAHGIDPRMLKAAIKAAEISPDDRAQVDIVFDTYLSALGGPPATMGVS